MKRGRGTLAWDLWIDFHAADEDGLISTLVAYAREGVIVVSDSHLRSRVRQSAARAPERDMTETLRRPTSLEL